MEYPKTYKQGWREANIEPRSVKELEITLIDAARKRYQSIMPSSMAPKKIGNRYNNLSISFLVEHYKSIIINCVNALSCLSNKVLDRCGRLH